MQNQGKTRKHVPQDARIFAWSDALCDRAFWTRKGQQAIAGALAAALLPMSMGAAFAQDQNAPPPPPPDYGDQGGGPGPDQGGPPPNSYQALPPQQLDQLVAPISLYPDALVAQILAASTYPQQVAAAEQFVQQNGSYPPQQLGEMANTQPWDPSVKALVAFPQVLNNLNQNMNWTTQLGNAYYNQPQDVMSAVQDMRQRAYAAGTLRPSPQLSVAYAPGDIVIAPVNPAVVYVPYYNPWVVYGAPIAVYPHYYWGPPAGVALGVGLAVGFGVGIAIGAFAHFGWGFHAWAPNWGARTVVFNHATYISRSNTVINHGYYGHFDRSPAARAFNAQQARSFGNHTTINNVTVNRGGNTYNRGGNTYNRGGNTFNGGNTYNRGGQTYNRGGQTYNRGGQTYNNGRTGYSGYNSQAGHTQGQYNARPQQQGHAAPQAQHSAPQHHSSEHVSHSSDHHR